MKRPVKSWLISAGILLAGFSFGVWAGRQQRFPFSHEATSQTDQASIVATTASEEALDEKTKELMDEAGRSFLEQKGGQVLQISDIKQIDERDPKASRKFTLQVSVKKKPYAKINHTKMMIQVFFYDTVGPTDIKLTDADVSYDWLTPSDNWGDRDTEILNVHYLRPKTAPSSKKTTDKGALEKRSDASPGGERKYLGYIARIYYDGRLQDLRAEPQKLAGLNPAPPSLALAQQTQNPATQAIQRGDYKAAADIFRNASDRGDPLATLNLGWFYKEGKGVPQDYNKAAELFRRCADRYPVCEAYLASCYAEGKGVPRDYDQALQLFHRALSKGPNPYVFNDFAWFLATCPDVSKRDGTQAVAYAMAACHMTGWKEKNFLGTLAAAYATSDVFEQAVSFQTRAMQLTGDYPSSDEMQRCLNLYQQRKPYREETGETGIKR